MLKNQNSITYIRLNTHFKLCLNYGNTETHMPKEGARCRVCIPLGVTHKYNGIGMDKHIREQTLKNPRPANDGLRGASHPSLGDKGENTDWRSLLLSQRFQGVPIRGCYQRAQLHLTPIGSLNLSVKLCIDQCKLEQIPNGCASQWRCCTFHKKYLKLDRIYHAFSYWTMHILHWNLLEGTRG